MTAIVVVVIVVAIPPEADAPRPAVQLQNIQPGAIAVGRVDKPAIVDFEVVRHVAVWLRGVGIAFRHIEPRLDRRLRLADVPRAHAAGEVSKESEPAVIRITEVLLARVHAETRSPRA